MKTAQTKPSTAPQPPTRARFLEVRAGRLRADEPRGDYSDRLALSRRPTAPTD